MIQFSGISDKRSVCYLLLPIVCSCSRNSGKFRTINLPEKPVCEQYIGGNIKDELGLDVFVIIAKFLSAV